MAQMDEQEFKFPDEIEEEKKEEAKAESKEEFEIEIWKYHTYVYLVTST